MLTCLSTLVAKYRKIMVTQEKFRNLGRWCHPAIPGCSADVIWRKTDFANRDNTSTVLVKSTLNIKEFDTTESKNAVENKVTES